MLLKFSVYASHLFFWFGMDWLFVRLFFCLFVWSSKMGVAQNVHDTEEGTLEIGMGMSYWFACLNYFSTVIGYLVGVYTGGW